MSGFCAKTIKNQVSDYVSTFVSKQVNNSINAIGLRTQPWQGYGLLTISFLGIFARPFAFY